MVAWMEGQGGNASIGGGGDDVGICDEKVHCKLLLLLFMVCLIKN